MRISSMMVVFSFCIFFTNCKDSTNYTQRIVGNQTFGSSCTASLEYSSGESFTTLVWEGGESQGSYDTQLGRLKMDRACIRCASLADIPDGNVSVVLSWGHPSDPVSVLRIFSHVEMENGEFCISPPADKGEIEDGHETSLSFVDDSEIPVGEACY